MNRIVSSIAAAAILMVGVARQQGTGITLPAADRGATATQIHAIGATAVSVAAEHGTASHTVVIQLLSPTQMDQTVGGGFWYVVGWIVGVITLIVVYVVVSILP